MDRILRGGCEDSPPVGTENCGLPTAVKNPSMKPKWAVIEITTRIKISNLNE